MADQKYKITDYDLIDELQPQDSLLVARLSEYRYYKLTWSIIQEKLDAKATAVDTAIVDTFGLAKVNEQGIVTEIKELEYTDIPELPISKITNLQNSLDSKVDKIFAANTNNQVIGSISSSVSQTIETIDERDVEVSTLSLTKTILDPTDNSSSEEVVEISSPDGSIQYSKTLDGKILLQVDPNNSQVQSDWEQSDNTEVDYIKNKPQLATVATSGSYDDLEDKLTFVSGDNSTLTIVKDQDSNEYTFTGLEKSTWGHIQGQLESQSDLQSKFAQYYTSAQVDNLIAQINQGLLKVKGYISEEDPLEFVQQISEGTLWLQSSTGGAPSGSTFLCNKLVIPEEPEQPYWDEVNYIANNFDVWINKNESSDDTSYFWLESSWEQLDFTVDLTPYAKISDLNQVAFTGNYNDLNHTPDFAEVAFSADYNDLINTPDIPAMQVQSDWDQDDSQAVDYIKNKPNFATVATSGSYTDLSNTPTIPAAQVNSDWNANSGVAQILNKPNIPNEISIEEIKLLLGNEDYIFNIKCFVIPNEYINLNYYAVDVYWNGIYLNEYYDYIWLLYPLVNYEAEDIYVGADLEKVLFSTFSYIQSNSPIIQHDWEIVFNNGIKVISSTSEKKINFYRYSETTQQYVFDTFLYTSLEGITYPEFLEHCQWVYNDIEESVITSITGTVDYSIIGSNPIPLCNLIGGPEEEDTDDIFTFVFKIASLD